MVLVLKSDILSCSKFENCDFRVQFNSSCRFTSNHSKEMAIIKSLRGFTPKMGDNCFLAENAVVVGDVTMGKNCTVWFNAVVRGDVNTIIIGDNTNIQDGAVIHCTYQKTKTIIGNNVSIGHTAVVH